MFVGGKLGEKESKSNTTFVKTPQEFYDYLLSGQFTVSDFDLVTDEILQLTYKKYDPFIATNPRTNVVLAA